MKVSVSFVLAIVCLPLAFLSGCAGVIKSQHEPPTEKIIPAPVAEKPVLAPVPAPVTVIPADKTPEVFVDVARIAPYIKAYAGKAENGFVGSPDMSKVRFKDNKNGTVSDSATGLIWLKNAGCLAPQSWIGALISVQMLESDVCGLKDGSISGQWRLPTVLELRSVLETATPFALVSQHFNNVKVGNYWTSNSFAGDPNVAWYVYTMNGFEDHDGLDNMFWIWPVRVMK